MICERPRGLGEIGARLGFRGHLKMVSEDIWGIGLRAVTRESQYLWSSDDVGEAWGIWLVWALEFISIWFEER